MQVRYRKETYNNDCYITLLLIVNWSFLLSTVQLYLIWHQPFRNLLNMDKMSKSDPKLILLSPANASTGVQSDNFKNANSFKF